MGWCQSGVFPADCLFGHARLWHQPAILQWQTKGKAMTDIDIESLQSEFLRLELLVKTAFDCADSSVESERNAALACLNAAQHSAQALRELLFTDA